MAMHDKLLLALLIRALRFQSFFSTQFERLEGLLSGFGLSVLDAEQRSRLTSAVYSARGDYRIKGLFDWERTWFEQDLPPAPAKLLVGGAGTGREVQHFVEQGYQIVAFDPAPSFVKRARRELEHPGCLTFVQGGFEDLVRTSELRRVVDAEQPFDATVFGWGSFTHVLSSSSRRQVLNAVHTCTPDGPLLLSFWMRNENTEMQRGRAWQLGWRLGQRLTGPQSAAPKPDPGDVLLGKAGFGHFFSLAEIENLANETGFEICRTPTGHIVDGYPHTTLRPAQTTD